MEDNNVNRSSKKLASFIDGTIITVLVSASLFSLSYAYNGGYNYYFGIPQMFTNSSWGGIVYRMPQISEIILFLSALSTIIVFTIRFLQYRKNIEKKNETKAKTNDMVYFLVFVIFFTIYDAYQFALNGTVIMLSALILMIALTLYLLSTILKTRKLNKELKRLGINLNEGVDSINLGNINAADLEKLKNKSNDILNFLKLKPTFKPILLSCSLAFYTFLFILVFIWGSSFAKKQTTFYCIGDNSIVTSTYGTNVLVASIEYDANDGQYFVTGEYSMLPQENLHFSIKQLGPIASRVKQDEIQISFNLFK